MALYAFDGTWNSDKPGSQHDTNVLWFKRAYTKDCFYREGVGTRFGPFGQVLGGISRGRRSHARSRRPAAAPRKSGRGRCRHRRRWIQPQGLRWRWILSNRVNQLGRTSDGSISGSVGLRAVVWRRQHRPRSVVGAGPARQRGQVLPRDGARREKAHLSSPSSQRARGGRGRRGPAVRGVVSGGALRCRRWQQQSCALQRRAQLDAAEGSLVSVCPSTPRRLRRTPRGCRPALPTPRGSGTTSSRTGSEWCGGTTTSTILWLSTRTGITTTRPREQPSSTMPVPWLRNSRALEFGWRCSRKSAVFGWQHTFGQAAR